jgi:hypothetical protein
LSWIDSRVKKMAKQQVIKCQCERCERVWYEEPDEGTPAITALVSFEGGDPTQSVHKTFGLLCQKCGTAVRNYIANILMEKVEGEAVLEAKEEEPVRAPLRV